MESVAVRLVKVVSVAVGPVTTVVSVAVRLLEIMSASVGILITMESVSVLPV